MKKRPVRASAADIASGRGEVISAVVVSTPVVSMMLIVLVLLFVSPSSLSAYNQKAPGLIWRCQIPQPGIRLRSYSIQVASISGS